MYNKRLEHGTFRLPEPLGEQSLSVAIDERTLDDLLDGIDIEAKTRKAPRGRVH